MDPALDDLFEREFEPMVRLARLVSDDPSEVEDIVMDAFEQTAKRIRQLDRPGAYLRTAVVNGARQRYRNRQRRFAILHRNQRELAIEEAGGELDYLGDLLGELPEREHTVIVLIYYARMTPTEVAQVLGCPPGTVRSLLHRTLARLREQVPA